MSKQRIFSGIQPSGNLHLGNYLGAIKSWVKLQDEFESIFCVVDLHAITVPQDPEELKRSTIEIAKTYLAAGIDPEKSTIFVQSQVSQHTELMWVLNTIVSVAELKRMTQFKDKTGLIEGIKEAKEYYEKHKEEMEKIEKKEQKVTFEDPMKKIKAGLMNYPILMAADILLYDTEVVPVGEDQVQHVEITRTLGRRFNQKFGETFKIPKAHVKKEGMRIMGLDNPENKMSKSAESKYNRIELLDSEDEIREKIKRAVTDSEQTIEYKDERPALKNLINIFSLVTDKKPQEIEGDYKDKGYKEFKEDLAEAVVNFLKPFQEKYNSISDDEVLEILKRGKEKVQPLAEQKMKEVKKKVGLG
jgi:tryptophanyl-tRNA synthetase